MPKYGKPGTSLFISKTAEMHWPIQVAFEYPVRRKLHLGKYDGFLFGELMHDVR